MGFDPRKTVKQATTGVKNVVNNAVKNPVATILTGGMNAAIPEALRASGLRGGAKQVGQALNQFGGGYGDSPKKQASTVGDNIAMPTLSQYTGIESLGDKGILQASNVSGNDISKQMEESPWYRMALQKQGAEQASMLDQAGQQNASSAAQAMSNLAMKGGLRSGAAERLAGQAGENTALNRQNIMGQGAVERGNLGMQAAGLSSDLAKFNAGNTQQAQFGNVQNQLGNLANVNDQNRFRYGEEMKLKGAGMSAQGIANAGKK
jgi:hypothetical protein